MRLFMYPSERVSMYTCLSFSLSVSSGTETNPMMVSSKLTWYICTRENLFFTDMYVCMWKRFLQVAMMPCVSLMCSKFSVWIIRLHACMYASAFGERIWMKKHSVRLNLWILSVCLHICLSVCLSCIDDTKSDMRTNRSEWMNIFSLIYEHTHV